MAVFEYKAKDKSGNIFSGTYSDIGNVATLQQELEKLDYVLVKAHRRKPPCNTRSRIKQADVVSFAHRFGRMCSAGLSIARCLQVLEEQAENPAFRSKIADIRQQVETGSSLTDAFGRYRDVFSDFFVGMLEAGESGGKLSETLKMAAVHLEKRADLRQQVKSAFAYPIAVGVMCLLVLTYLLVFVVPVFSNIYQKLNVNLPGPTQALITISTLFREWWVFILVGILGCVVLARKFSKNPKVRAKWDAFKLEMPVLGKLNRMLVVSRFIRTFAILASAGVSYIKAFEVAGSVANNHIVKDISIRLQERIERGSTVTEAMVDYDIFPPMIIHLAASGEEAGILPDMLNKSIDFLDKDIDRAMKALVMKLEPALTLVMGAIVGFILIGTYLPMFDYMSHLK